MHHAPFAGLLTVRPTSMSRIAVARRGRPILRSRPMRSARSAIAMGARPLRGTRARPPGGLPRPSYRRRATRGVRTRLLARTAAASRPRRRGPRTITPSRRGPPTVTPGRRGLPTVTPGRRGPPAVTPRRRLRTTIPSRQRRRGRRHRSRPTGERGVRTRRPRPPRPVKRHRGPPSPRRASPMRDAHHRPRIPVLAILSSRPVWVKSAGRARRSGSYVPPDQTGPGTSTGAGQRPRLDGETHPPSGFGRSLPSST